jgi:hypothetical protein
MPVKKKIRHFLCSGSESPVVQRKVPWFASERLIFCHAERPEAWWMGNPAMAGTDWLVDSRRRLNEALGASPSAPYYLEYRRDKARSSSNGLARNSACASVTQASTRGQSDHSQESCAALAALLLASTERPERPENAKAKARGVGSGLWSIRFRTWRSGARGFSKLSRRRRNQRRTNQICVRLTMPRVREVNQTKGACNASRATSSTRNRFVAMLQPARRCLPARQPKRKAAR